MSLYTYHVIAPDELVATWYDDEGNPRFQAIKPLRPAGPTAYMVTVDFSVGTQEELFAQVEKAGVIFTPTDDPVFTLNGRTAAWSDFAKTSAEDRYPGLYLIRFDLRNGPVENAVGFEVRSVLAPSVALVLITDENHEHPPGMVWPGGWIALEPQALVASSLMNTIERSPDRTIAVQLTWGPAGPQPPGWSGTRRVLPAKEIAAMIASGSVLAASAEARFGSATADIAADIGLTANLGLPRSIVETPSTPETIAIIDGGVK